MSTARYPTRLPYLDAARGIAALIVIAGHYICWGREHEPAVYASSILINASDAVSFFFVLSGMVLSYPYLVLGKSMDIRKYVINRFFRLLPAFFVAMLCFAAYIFRKEPFVKGFLDVIVYNNHGFWEETLMIRGWSNYIYPAWTLGIELCLSMLVPFFVIIAQRNRRALFWLLAVILIGGAPSISRFAFHFVLGVIASSYFKELNDPSFRQRRVYRWRYAVLFLAYVLFSIRHIDKLSPFGPSFKYLLEYLSIDWFHFTALSSFVFLCWLLLSKKAQRVLNGSVFQFYGRISYTIYLVHALILSLFFDNLTPALTERLGGFWSTFFIGMAVVFASSTLFGYLMHIAVEQPGIRFGKRLISRLKPSVVIAGITPEPEPEPAAQPEQVR